MASIDNRYQYATGSLFMLAKVSALPELDLVYLLNIPLTYGNGKYHTAKHQSLA